MTVVSSADLTKQKQEVDLGFPLTCPPVGDNQDRMDAFSIVGLLQRGA